MSKLQLQVRDQVLGMKEDNDANVEAVLLTDDSEADQDLEILLYICPIIVYYLWFLAYHHLFLKNVDRDAKKKHVQLIKDRKLFEKRIREMEERCNQMMIQKFGRIVDLEKLETVTVNRQLEELKEKLRQVEEDCASEIRRWNVSQQFFSTRKYNSIRKM